jgi:rfaE bifunctional protein nucleotidyltransferase chain/domain
MNLIDFLQQKIMTPVQLTEAIHTWRKDGDRIVFTNGCFDILHLGHIDYLARAADNGDRLVIGLNTDASVTRLKGPHRPINDERCRGLLLAALSFTDAVVLFDEPTPYELIRLAQPDVLVKGADYKPEEIVGYDVVTGRGGEVITIPFVPGYSTSSIEQRIRSIKN